MWDPTLPRTRTGRFWVYLGDAGNPYCVYDFTPLRTRDGPERLLADFRGCLQADSFTGYNRICAVPGVIHMACWAHVRRKPYQYRTTVSVPAHVELARIRQLYRIEETCREMSVPERRAGRRPCTASWPAASGSGAIRSRT